MKFAIFVNGEFWHRSNWHKRENDHKTNQRILE
ncbi:MAG: hypothetical protein HC892_18680 [Saprospiraceae bacterium]|nr:hypothetical protein [Saprospiraceae bacterium]